MHYGLNGVLWKGVFLYRKEAANPKTLEQYGSGCPNDWMERNIYSPKGAWGVVLMLLIDLACFGLWGALIWGIQMVWIPFWAAGVINGVGHALGYRNFECNDHARNIIPIGLIMGGEELHNNHHAYPNSARLSSKIWEFDIGWFWVCIFSGLGLAKVRFSKPLVRVRSEKEQNICIDSNTMMAIVNNRFHVMANYTRQVIKPLINSEKNKVPREERGQLRFANKLLSSSDAILEPRQREKILQITARFKQLNIIYEQRIALQEIWQKIKCNRQRIEALTRWCHEAEQSGIQVLKKFSQQLRCYTLPSSSE